MSPSVATNLVVHLLTFVTIFAQAQASPPSLDIALAHPTLLAGSRQTTYLKVGLFGTRNFPDRARPPVNVAFVIDRSGSMEGAKLEKAKEAAIQALNRLSRNDIVSVTVYDSTVQVVLPATKLTDRQAVQQAIRGITSGGSTALFAGVSKGAAEVRKFLDRNRVNRVILLSDGLANVGPSSPAALGDLGASLMKEGIAVTTLGLGLDYNEDLMFQLAYRSDGNHVFVEQSSQLASVFNREFNDVLSVVAQEVAITIHCASGVRPVRLLGIDGEINGQNAIVHLNQLYGNQEKYALLEVEVGESGDRRLGAVADVMVSYTDMQTGKTGRLSGSASVQFDASPQVVQRNVNEKVMTECVLQIANERNALATTLRDEGKIAQAKALLDDNKDYLMYNANKFNSEALRQQAIENRQQSERLDSSHWKANRKQMRSTQYGSSRGGSQGQQREEQETNPK